MCHLLSAVAGTGVDGGKDDMWIHGTSPARRCKMGYVEPCTVNHLVRHAVWKTASISKSLQSRQETQKVNQCTVVNQIAPVKGQIGLVQPFWASLAQLYGFIGMIRDTR